ncbi:MAG: class I SAM-dependent methyltransferase [Anaerolineae bacterium]|nr:class I SAM-dependent methyltransferase [Anaerolineae bacterium]
MNMPSENWASGDAYEQFMGRWSADVAALFLDHLQPAADSAWLDVGCGTGALTRMIAARVQPRRLVGVDSSLDFARYARQRNQGATFITASATALPAADDTFDFVVSGLALNFFPQPEQALREGVRVAKPGGIVAAYVWDYAGKMEFLRYFWDAALALDAGAKPLHEGHRFPICQPDPLQQLWQSAGLQHVSLHPLDAVTRFDSFEGYWQPFTFGNFPAPQYALSLDAARRQQLHDHLRASIPTERDGSIQLIARAWAVLGQKPSL